MTKPADARVAAAAVEIVRTVRSDRVTSRQLLELLTNDNQQPGLDNVDAVLTIALDRFAEALAGVVEPAVRYAVDDDREYLAGIRRFFLKPQNDYSVEELAVMWDVPSEYIADIGADELVEWEARHGTSGAPRIPWSDALSLSIAFYILRPFDVERALGEEFAAVRTEMWRTVPVVLRLPRFVIDALRKDATGLDGNDCVTARLERFVLELYAVHDRTPKP